MSSRKNAVEAGERIDATFYYDSEPAGDKPQIVEDHAAVMLADKRAAIEKAVAQAKLARAAVDAKEKDEAALSETDIKKVNDLLHKAFHQAEAGALNDACKTLEKLINFAPTEPEAYEMLGNCHKSLGDRRNAAVRYMQCVERAEPRSDLWAAAVSSAFNELTQVSMLPQLASLKPSWWTDASLKRLAAQVVVAEPNQMITWKMKAEVLCGLNFDSPSMSLAGGVTPRTGADHQMAAACFTRAAELSTGGLRTGMTHWAEACRMVAGKYGPTENVPMNRVGSCHMTVQIMASRRR
jgi:tetratricopeptide (TPR) repeat protein